MASSQHQEEFLSYVRANPQVQPLAVFPAWGRVGKDLPLVYAGLHIGMVAVFPEYLAFLTTETDGPGLGLAAKQIGKVYADALVDKGKEFLGLGAIIVDVMNRPKEQAKQNRELREAMENPQSLFIPLRSLRTVETGRQLATHYLRVGTTERDYVFMRQPEKSLLKLLDQLVGEWQPEAVAYLRQVAARNTGAAPATPPQGAPASPPPAGTHTAQTPQSAPPRPVAAPIPTSATRAGAAPSPAAGKAATASAARPQRRSSGRGLLLTLLVLALVVGGIAYTQHHGSGGGAGGASNLPDVSGSYSGTAYNNIGVNAPMTLTLDQEGMSLSGAFTVSSPLGGSGPLQGEVDSSGDISFEVTSTDGTGITIDFTGAPASGGNELTGTYTVNNGQSGRWDATR